jgi:hypothetical protein
MCNVMFFNNGYGKWIKREWSIQCSEKILFSNQCQGIKGHKDVHWYYKSDGSFAWADNKNDPRHDGYSGSTPPDHEKYVTPQSMMEKLWLTNFIDFEVMDKEEIARLEKGEMRDNESVVRSYNITKEELEQNEIP